MATLKGLSAAQLKKIIDDTQSELTRRKNIDLATAAIRTILKKYKIDAEDVNLNITAGTRLRNSTKKRSKETKPRDKRSAVQARYKDPSGTATWSGRGGTPAWVQSICQNEGIDIEAFKKDDRFQC